MAEHSPIYSAKTARQQIGYIEGDRAFDLSGKPCATYNSSTGLLRDPNNDAIVGYVTLANIFVGAFNVAEQIFPKAERVASPQASTNQRHDQIGDTGAAGFGHDHSEHDHGENVRVRFYEDRPPRSQELLNAEAAEPFSTAADTTTSQLAPVPAPASLVAIISALAEPRRDDEDAGIAFTAPTGSELENSQQLLQPPSAAVDKNLASTERESGDLNPAVGDAPNARATEPVDADLPSVVASDDRAECGEPDEAPSGGKVPPAVEEFMRRLADYLDPNTHPLAIPGAETDGTAVPGLSPRSDTHTDQTLLSDQHHADESAPVSVGDDLALQAVEEGRAALLKPVAIIKSAQDPPFATAPVRYEPVVATELGQDGAVLESAPTQDEGFAGSVPAQDEPLIAGCGESVGESESEQARGTAAQGPSGEQTSAEAEQTAAEAEATTEQRRAAEDDGLEAAGERSQSPSPPTDAGEAWERTSRDHIDFDTVGRDRVLGEFGDPRSSGMGQNEIAAQADIGLEKAPPVAFFDPGAAALPGVAKVDNGTGQDQAQSREDFGGAVAAANDSAIVDDKDNSGDIGMANFFAVDAERAVAVTKTELAVKAEGTGGDTESPEDLFAVDIERAVRIVRKVLGEQAPPVDGPEPHSALQGEGPRPTQKILPTDMDRILRAVLNELEKK
jgi:hypothetical protein